MTQEQTEPSAPPPLPLESVDTSAAMRNYVVLALGILFGFRVVPWLHGLGLVVLLWGFFRAYRLRADKSADGLVSAHGLWMVRTFWITSLYSLVATIVAGVILSMCADQSSIEAFGQVVKDNPQDSARVSEAFMAYFNANLHITRMVTFICFIPVGFFAAARCVIGYMHAYRGEGLANPKTWLVR